MDVKTTFKAACIQLNTNNDLSANISRATTLITKAANAGAQFITLPENAFFMGASREETFANARLMEEHPAVLAMMELAGKLAVWLLFGVAVKAGKDAAKLKNRSILIGADGKVVNFYDKIHLFDVDINGGESHRESDNFEAGSRAVLAELPWAKLGMTICYDLRFPNLFRTLAQAGAQIITMPSAFTHKTGTVHWHSLLRARAIENACYIIAPAQCGHHPRGRRTFGHSLIIDPWGEVLAEGSESYEEFVVAEIDIAYLKTVRQSLPSLRHDKQFKVY